ncbi:unnamed protein product [Orchesella dallaii]|uniref:G-protein coupled receptors family 1 profile domain-containing protein n=1 Tax=Orchesella dallaii TaxID=48710 RepID=A0ABP1RU04_9HEXA
MDPDRVASVTIPDFPTSVMITPTSPQPMEADTSELIADSDGGATSGRNESLAKIEITVLSVILVIAIVGNSLMLIALRRQLNFRPMSRMYFFMLNLSIADLFVAFGNILPQLAWDITFRFQGNDLLCRIVKFLQVFVLYVSTYILTSMAIDRYLVVCHHTFSRNYYSGLKGPRILVAASYIFSFLLATPQVFIFSYMDVPNNPGIRDCWVTFIEPWGQKAYVTFFVVCAFIFPLMVIGVSYGAICCKVIRFRLPKEARVQKPQNKRRKTKYSFSSSSAGTRDEQETESVDEAPLRKASEERGALRRQISQAKMKTLKLTLTVVICFFVCWAPFSITQLVIAYNPAKNAGPLQVIFLLLASLNSCTNPWIYLAFSESLCNQLRVRFSV